MLPVGESTVKDISLMYARNYPTASKSRSTGPRGGFGGSFSDSPDVWPAEEREFVFEPGRVNEWKIVLPEWLIKRIRLSVRVAEVLKAQQQAGNTN